MKNEPWRGNMHARCLHLEGKLGRQAREIERMERKLAEAKALLLGVTSSVVFVPHHGYRRETHTPDGWFDHRDAFLNLKPKKVPDTLNQPRHLHRQPTPEPEN